MFYFFFFQAEDGIRDGRVTGVQTCALPIFTAHADAQCLDVEPGDATNADAPAWVKRQIARGVYRPVVYTSLSNVNALLRALAAAGISRPQVRLWTAHYTGREHLCA